MLPASDPRIAQMTMIFVFTELAVIGPIMSFGPHIFQVDNQSKKLLLDFIRQLVNLLLDISFVTAYVINECYPIWVIRSTKNATPNIGCKASVSSGLG